MHSNAEYTRQPATDQSLAEPDVAYSSIDFCDVYVSPFTASMAAAMALPTALCVASSGASAEDHPYGRRMSWPLATGTDERWTPGGPAVQRSRARRALPVGVRSA